MEPLPNQHLELPHTTLLLVKHRAKLLEGLARLRKLVLRFLPSRELDIERPIHQSELVLPAKVAAGVVDGQALQQSQLGLGLWMVRVVVGQALQQSLLE